MNINFSSLSQLLWIGENIVIVVSMKLLYATWTWNGVYCNQLPNTKSGSCRDNLTGFKPVSLWLDLGFVERFVKEKEKEREKSLS